MPPRKAASAAAKPAAAAAAAVPQKGKKAAAKKQPEPEPEEEEEESEDEQYSGGEEDEEGEDDDEEGEDDEDEDGEHPLADLGAVNLPSLLAMISNMKKQDGPIVTGVLLSVNGASSQVTLDMTPAKDAVGKLLGGKATFVGSYPAPLDVAIMSLHESVSAKAAVNKHTLPPPYDRDAGKLRGPIVLVRMDENSDPVSITLQEYNDFLANPQSAKAAAAAAAAPAAAASKKGGKKQGMTTEQAAALARNKRKSAGEPEQEEEEEAEEEQPKAKRAKKAGKGDK